MRILSILAFAFIAVALPSAGHAQSAPPPATSSADSRDKADGDQAKSEQSKKQARKERREHRRMVNHRRIRKH